MHGGGQLRFFLLGVSIKPERGGRPTDLLAPWATPVLELDVLLVVDAVLEQDIPDVGIVSAFKVVESAYRDGRGSACGATEVGQRKGSRTDRESSLESAGREVLFR